MTAVAPPPDVVQPAGRFSGLLRAEVHRFLARRFIGLLVALAALAGLVGLVIALLYFRSPSSEGIAAARAEIDRVVAEQEQYRQECLRDPSLPAGADPADFCGGPVRAADFSVADFLHPEPFSLAELGTGGAIAVAVACSALAFLVGATFVGAEWSSRSMVSLLFWEPRRGRVLGAKALVVGGASLVLGVVGQVAWLVASQLLQAVAGDDQPLPDGFWGELSGVAGRGVLLTALVGLLGFGLTNLVRNTGAALGVAFVYLVIAENAARGLLPRVQPWLVTENVAALLQPGGMSIVLDWDMPPGANPATWQPEEHLITNLHAGLLLTAVTAVIAGVGIWLFHRRDVS
ncbi:hypothetical protein [Modestobacter sp. NPDC049651]|uniref:hypothetical protein n=1 Tax=unclassified Modestobacter TaxID=2643866 RepID=UPI0033D8FCCB